jgi:acyl-CoA synthetase
MRAFLTLHHPEQARRYYADGVWATDTFYSLLAGHASAHPQAPALRDGRATLSWHEVRSRTDALAADLSAQGLTAGDRVSLWLSNRNEAVIAFLACSRQGLACNPSLHRTYTCREVADLLALLGSAAFITELGWGADREGGRLEEHLGGLSALRKVYDAAEGLPLTGAGPQSAPVHDPDGVAYLAFTSGTTGTPKCVMHSCNTLLANPRDMVRDWGVDAGTRLLTLSPLSHHIAWVAVSQWLLSGCLLVIDDPPPGTSKLEWLLETGATYVMGVPTHAMDMLAEQRARGIARLGEVRTFYMAGSPIPPSVAAAFVEQGIKPQNVYGMTENSSHQYTHPDDDTDTIVATCGRGGPAYRIRVFDTERADVAIANGEVGQIAGKGGALMLGYFANQADTEASFNGDGWFLSGDLGALDEAGNLHVVGRLKDLIIRGGHNIYPSHVEAAALRHPQVEKVAMFAVPDERLGEKACIAVLGPADPGALLDHLAAQGVSRYDMPEYFLRVEAFPLTASGKILKRELAERAKRGELDLTAVRYRPDKERAS